MKKTINRPASSINFKNVGNVENKTKKNIPIHDTKSVLDLSKILIHNFYYDYMIPKWSKNYAPLIDRSIWILIVLYH